MKLDINSASITTSLLIISAVVLLWYVKWSEKNKPHSKSRTKKK